MGAPARRAGRGAGAPRRGRSSSSRTHAARSGCACTAGCWRCRPRARAARPPPTTSTAAASWPPSDPQGDELFSTLIALWAYYLSCAELGRSREISTTLQAALAGERSFFVPQNRAGFGDARLVRRRLRRPRPEGSSRPRASWPRSAPATRSPPRGSCPTTRRSRCTRTSGSRASWPATRPVPRPASRRRGRSPRQLDFPHGPWSTAYAIWLHSWLQIETGADEPAEAALAGGRRGRRGARVRGLGGDRDDPERRAGGAARPAHGRGAGDAESSTPRRWRSTSRSGRRSGCGSSCPSTSRPPARCSRARASRRRRASATSSRSRSPPRPACASTTPRRCAGSPGSRTTRGRRCEAALELAVRQGARPFELRIERDLDRAR